jgi:hypothetical protein
MLQKRNTQQTNPIVFFKNSEEIPSKVGLNHKYNPQTMPGHIRPVSRIEVEVPKNTMAPQNTEAASSLPKTMSPVHRANQSKNGKSTDSS